MEEKRTIPVCFKPEEIELIENIAKKLGMKIPVRQLKKSFELS